MKRAVSTPTTLSPSRRSLLAGTPLAALFALAPHATLGQVDADRELGRLQGVFQSEFLAFQNAHEVGDESEINAAHMAYWRVLRQIIDTPAETYSGLSIKAKIAQEYGAHDGALEDFMDSLISDCIRLGGGVV